MTTNTPNQQLVWVVLAIVAALVVLSAFVVGFGMVGAGPMMGSMWGAVGASGWILVTSGGMQPFFPAVIIGAAYLGYRALTKQDKSSDSILEELPAAYARGDLSDDEYERRQERLETEP